MPDYAARTDGFLVQLAREGDRAAFAVLLHRTMPEVRAHVAGTTRPDGHLTDRIAAVYAAAAARLRELDDPDALRPWLLELTTEVDGRRWRPRRRGGARGSGMVWTSARAPAVEDEVWRRLTAAWSGRAHREHGYRATLAAATVVAVAVVAPMAVAATSRTEPATAEIAAVPLEAPSPSPTVAATTPPPADFVFPTAPEALIVAPEATASASPASPADDDAGAASNDEPAPPPPDDATPVPEATVTATPGTTPPAPTAPPSAPDTPAPTGTDADGGQADADSLATEEPSPEG